MGLRNLAVIPARSGSKGLPDKNIRMLHGKPLMAYTIGAARASGMFAEVVVSTDSEAYAQVARQWGATTPFLRSDQLSSDTASSWDVVRDLIKRLSAEGAEFDTVALLQPTSPLRAARDIVRGYREFVERDAEAIVGVCEVDHSPLWSNVLPADHSLRGFISRDVQVSSRQQLPRYYRINGAIYIVRVEALCGDFDLYGRGSYALVMPRERSIDIDDVNDFLIAETFLTARDLSPEDSTLSEGESIRLHMDHC